MIYISMLIEVYTSLVQHLVLLGASLKHLICISTEGEQPGWQYLSWLHIHQVFQYDCVLLVC